ncbi:MAG TPA: glycoside hydrolase family 15 protein [Candidatus Saccharimonadales bacterium]|nr:glycoside hydrolase family 15 protein [Candidatus Saccharimonadales bacterium]
MARPIVLSNGTLHVGINLFGLVHDLYYPHVGHENHAAANKLRHLVGVWVNGEFSWLDDGNWEFSFSYEPHALIGHTSAHNKQLDIMLEFTDCVDSERNVFMRTIHVVNARSDVREIRLFMHQVLIISNSLGADTAQYLPEQSGILLYKGRRAFVVGGQGEAGNTFNQFSIGSFGIEGKEGTYRDAEDGQLSGNPVEHGRVDSVIGFTMSIEGFSSTRVSYWLTAAKTQSEAIALHQMLQRSPLAERFMRTAEFWHRWLAVAEPSIKKLPKHVQGRVRQSLLITKAHINHNGAVIASTDTAKLNYDRDAYAYFWPRDGAYGLWPLMRLGYKTELKRFFEFCRTALHPQGFLMHKYQADGAPGSSWHPYLVAGRIVPPIQEDETAITVILFDRFLATTKDRRLLEEFYDSLIVPMANFMASYIDPHTKLPHATYDLWEEKFLTTTYTTATVYAALTAAATMAQRLKRQADAVRWQTVADDIRLAAHSLLFNTSTGYFCKGFINKAGEHGIDLDYDLTIDSSSFYGAYLFGLFEPDASELTQSFKTLQATFSLGGEPWLVPRYAHDKYQLADPASIGNPWFVCSLWAAQYALLTGNAQKAEQVLDAVAGFMLKTGVLPEQVGGYNHKKIAAIAPLVWSQAEFINTALDIAKQKETHGL